MPAPHSIPPSLAEHLSKYARLQAIDSSGPETVYAADDTIGRRRVAIKLLSEGDSESAEAFAQRQRSLIRAATISGKLNHPNIVAIYDVGVQQGGMYLVMEYVDGGSLERKIAAQRVLDPEYAAAILLDAAAALDYAHKSGIVHCDMSPCRILVAGQGGAKIAGFSLARSLGATSVRGGATLPRSLVFAAPEQLRGDAERATDQFSLAAIAYYALTGRRPFPAPMLVTLIRQILTETPVPASRLRPELPPALDAVLQRGMAKNPADRYRDCTQFAEAVVAAFRPDQGQTLWKTLWNSGTGRHGTRGKRREEPPTNLGLTR